MFSDGLPAEQQSKFIHQMEQSLYLAGMMGAFNYHLSLHLESILDSVDHLIDIKRFQELPLPDMLGKLLAVTKPEKHAELARILLDHFIEDSHANKVQDALQIAKHRQGIQALTKTFSQMMYLRLTELQSEVETQH